MDPTAILHAIKTTIEITHQSHSTLENAESIGNIYENTERRKFQKHSTVNTDFTLKPILGQDAEKTKFRNKILHFILSPNFANILMITAAILLTGPIGGAITLACIAANTAIQARGLSKLKNIQSENILLSKTLEIENEKSKLLEDNIGKSLESILLENHELNLGLNSAEVHQNNQRKISNKIALKKQLQTHGLEYLTMGGMSTGFFLGAIEPASLAIGLTTMLLRTAVDHKKQKAFESEKNVLLEQNEKLSNALGIDYQYGKSIEQLKETFLNSYLEKEAIKIVKEKITSGELDVSNKKSIQIAFAEAKENVKENLPQEMKSFTQKQSLKHKTIDFFSNVKNVITHGFSSENQYKLMSPCAHVQHMDRNAINNARSTFQERVKILNQIKSITKGISTKKTNQHVNIEALDLATPNQHHSHHATDVGHHHSIKETLDLAISHHQDKENFSSRATHQNHKIDITH